MIFDYLQIIISIISSAVTAIIFIFGWLITVGRKIQIIDDLKSTFLQIQQDVKMLIERISKLEGRFEAVIGKGSPLEPTELGVRYIKESGLEKILEEKRETLFESLKKYLIKEYTDYDVQEAARRVLLLFKDDPIMNSIKEYAFDNSLEIEVILSAGALWLRDDFLNRPRGVVKENKEKMS